LRTWPVFIRMGGCIGPLHNPVTWYKITHAGTQQGDFQNKGRSRWTGTSYFVLEVPLYNLRASMCDFVPYNRIVQRAHCNSVQAMLNQTAVNDSKGESFPLDFNLQDVTHTIEVAISLGKYK